MLDLILLGMALGNDNLQLPPPAPRIGTLRMTTTAGDFSTRTWATVTLTWDFDAASASGYEVRVYKNGNLLATSASMSSSHTHTLTGVVEAGEFSSFTTDWLFEVKLIEQATALAVTVLTAKLNKKYGAGTGGGGSGPGSPGREEFYRNLK